MDFFFSFFPGDIYKEEIRVNEEGLWAECSVWLWDCSDHLQQHQQTVPVCQHWHGQGVAEIYWVQWAAWESNEFRYCWGKIFCSVRILFWLCSETEVLKPRGLIIFLKGCRTYPGGDTAAGKQNRDNRVLVWGLEMVQQRPQRIRSSLSSRFYPPESRMLSRNSCNRISGSLSSSFLCCFVPLSR